MGPLTGMRNLRVKDGKLLPVHSGGNIGTCHVLRYLTSPRDWPAIGERLIDILQSVVNNRSVSANAFPAYQA